MGSKLIKIIFVKRRKKCLPLTSQDKVYYVACPAQLISGGAELLHQLCYELNKKGFNAYMYYIKAEKCEILRLQKDFYIMKIRMSLEIEDLRQNLLVVPETLIDNLNQFSI